MILSKLPTLAWITLLMATSAHSQAVQNQVVAHPTVPQSDEEWITLDDESAQELAGQISAELRASADEATRASGDALQQTSKRPGLLIRLGKGAVRTLASGATLVGGTAIIVIYGTMGNQLSSYAHSVDNGDLHEGMFGEPSPKAGFEACREHPTRLFGHIRTLPGVCQTLQLELTATRKLGVVAGSAGWVVDKAQKGGKKAFIWLFVRS
jgi:hypothetical protein